MESKESSSREIGVNRLKTFLQACSSYRAGYLGVSAKALNHALGNYEENPYLQNCLNDAMTPGTPENEAVLTLLVAEVRKR